VTRPFVQAFLSLCVLALAAADHSPAPAYHAPAPVYHAPAPAYHSPVVHSAPAYHAPVVHQLGPPGGERSPTRLHPSRGVSMERQLAEAVKVSLARLSGPAIGAMARRHLRHLRLLDPAGAWRHPRLATIGHRLLPGLDREDLARLVDAMAEKAAKNPYLHYFLAQQNSTSVSELKERVGKEGNRKFPSIVTYAALMERLNQEMLRDWKVAEICHRIWQKEHSNVDVLRYALQNFTLEIGLFPYKKVMTIRNMVEQIFGSWEWFKGRKRVASSPFKAYDISLNILEAAAEDVRLLNLTTPWWV
jgi:hypothetical protein